MDTKRTLNDTNRTLHGHESGIERHKMSLNHDHELLKSASVAGDQT